MDENFQVREGFVLRRILGGMFFLVALPVLLFAVLAATASVYLMALVALVNGIIIACLGLFAIRVDRSARVRLRFTDKGLWLMPDKSDWFLLEKPKHEPVTLPWREIVRIEDGGAWYGYRRLRFSTEEVRYQMNTTFLDTDLRSIVIAIDKQLRKSGRKLEEQGVGMIARSGKWHVKVDRASFE